MAQDITKPFLGGGGSDSDDEEEPLSESESS